ncbi:MAG: hypothetical protein LBK98_02145 [Peptococcaceae bacterium]|jgi:hypothetical protein|nr:hypothetical protein [Peptococcaceae bacterium]
MPEIGERHRHKIGEKHRHIRLLWSAGRLASLAFVFFLLFYYLPAPLRAEPILESDFAPSLLTAVMEVTGLSPIFPLEPEDPFFAVTTLDLNNRAITSLKGIHFFAGLTRLTLEHNKLSTLKDAVFPDEIRYLSFAHNGITDIEQTHWPLRLRTLDLRNNRLISPLHINLPENISSLTLDNNFLTSRSIGLPKECAVTYAGNFIYEASVIRPASLVVKNLTAVSLPLNGQQAVPFVNITTSTNPNNQVPPQLISASLSKAGDSPVQLQREDYRFLLTARQPGSDNLTVHLALNEYQLTLYENMSLTFHKTTIPITVWQSAEQRPGASSPNNGDAAVQIAVSGRSNNAVVDMTRFPGGRASFSPGLLAQLTDQNKKLILTHDFGNLTLDEKNLRSITRQAAVSANATVLITLNTYDIRPVGYSPSRFSEKELYTIQYKDFYFQAQLQVPGAVPEELDLGAPVSATLYLINQTFSEWDFHHLTAFKDTGEQLDLLGGAYNIANGSFSYILNGNGRYGLGTRGKQVQWVDLSVNSTEILHSDGTVGQMDPAPLLYRGVTMIPVRSVFEKMGAYVNWNPSIQAALISFGNKTLYIQENTTIGSSGQMPYMINNRMLVPLRYVSAEIGATVLWWNQEGRIRIVY